MQVKKFLLDPISTASKSGTMGPQDFPCVLLVHGLERFGYVDHFQLSFLDELADILSTMVSGKHTRFPRTHRLTVCIQQVTSTDQDLITN
jgi:hypothetical protein